MEQRKAKWREGSAVPTPVDQILAGRYSELSRWGMVLTRGDAGKTEDIVQELCLYFTLTKPDLTTVVNLDGYLYTSLRHIYLSGLARSSREALHFVSIAEFDNFESALAADPSGDTLEKQNDLRCICNYTVWRKQSSKTASYFILHFFHGYARREIAELACLPLSAIYNKLKVARSEVISHLETTDKLRIVNRETPPKAILAWNLLSPAELFNELRSTILHARVGDCLDEEQLLAHYWATRATPISCSLLSHVVSCERCLSVIDRHFLRPTLKDREPLDCMDTSGDGSNASANNASNASLKVKDDLSGVRRRWGRVHEHRPRTLSIAVNGHVVAFHDVIGEHSKLSARIEHPTDADFIEVFSEQDVRFALLSIGELPPGGAPVRIHRVELSDDRWLELSLTFDGQGLQGQVAYFDPAFAAVAMEEEPEELSAGEAGIVAAATPRHSRLDVLAAGWRSMLAAMTPSSAFAWALIVAVVLAGGAGYFAYQRRYQPIDAAQLLSDSIRRETANLQGQTEHQVVRIEDVSAAETVLRKGQVIVWKDGDGRRLIRRLYDLKHNMIAAEWQDGRKDGSQTRVRKHQAPALGDSPMGQYWDQELSSQAFAAMDNGVPRVRSIDGGFELTRMGSTRSHPQLLSATMILDRNLQPIRQVLRVRVTNEVRELRFEQADYDRTPSTSVPDATFNPDLDPSAVSGPNRRSSIARPLTSAGATKAQIAELQIGVLYQLHMLHADTEVPIEVVRTADNRVRVSGTVNSNALKEAIYAHLKNLDGGERLDLRIVSAREIAVPSGSKRSALVEAYEVNQPSFAADMRIREYLQAKAFSGGRLDAAVALFSRDALQHAQRALQHAYALDRLGSSLPVDDLHSIRAAAQQEWTGMVKNHANGLETELRALHGQLAGIMLARGTADDADTVISAEAMSIDRPAQFALRAGRLLAQVRQLNRQTGELFASSGKTMSDASLNSALLTIIDTIPLRQAEDVSAFATLLSGHNSTAETRPITQ